MSSGGNKIKSTITAEPNNEQWFCPTILTFDSRSPSRAGGYLANRDLPFVFLPPFVHLVDGFGDRIVEILDTVVYVFQSGGDYKHPDQDDDPEHQPDCKPTPHPHEIHIMSPMTEVNDKSLF